MALDLRKRDPVAVGHYDLLGRVGTGAYGSVFKARDRGTGTVVAVKLLPDDLADHPKLLRRFEQEFRAATKLDHPNIVRTLDFGLENSRPYLVMEFVAGRSLGEIIEQNGKLDEARAVRIITQVAQALHYAHRRRIIHRDVKPDNILVRPDGLAKLADFGLAKDVDSDHNLTRPASGLGTPHFMAPEQYEDAKNAGVPCDVYSLGATLYNAVTGKVPFDSCVSLVALAKKIKGDIAPPRKLVPELSERVNAAICRALSPNPTSRPATCLQFAKMLPTRRSRPSGVRRGLPPPDGERRVATRHSFVTGATCIVETALFPGEPGSEEPWPAAVRDLSATGVGLSLARRFEPGTVFSVELERGRGGAPLMIQAKVAHVRSEDLGHWLHGCAFTTPLTEEQLREFV